MVKWISTMDAFDLFRKLGTGAKFDYKRFQKDAEILLLTKNSAQRSDLGIKQHQNNTVLPGKRKTECNQRTNEKRFKGTEDDIDDDDDDDSRDGEDIININNNNIVQELRILGNITSKEENVLQKRDNRKKRKAKRKTAEKIHAIRKEEISHIRNQHRIHVYGTDVPDPACTFEDLESRFGLNPQIIKNIQAVGYQTPTPIQIQAIPAMCERRELMACAPTGSGKTAAFIIPLLHHLKEHQKQGIRALVLAPTRELGKQIHREFQRLSEGIGLKIQYIQKASTAAKKLGPTSTKKCDILVSTPNRLIHMLKQNPAVIDLSLVEWLVVDESDKLFEEGQTGFRDQLAVIYKACDNKNVRRAMFSATFAYDVEEWCKLNLDNVLQVYIGARNTATDLIEQELQFTGRESGKMLAFRDIIRKGIQPPVLVFVQSKDRAKELYQELVYDGMNVDVIHADRTQVQRDNVVKNFRSGKTWILICTELMGRGIDFKGVNLVVNYDFPNSAIGYIHRIGRTGRAGRPGRAITFFTEDDATNLRSIANVMKEAGCPVPEYMLQIKQPSKKMRKRLSQRVPKRPRISTISNYDIQRAKRKRNIIQNQKKKKTKQVDPTDIVREEVKEAKKQSKIKTKDIVAKKNKMDKKLKTRKHEVKKDLTS